MTAAGHILVPGRRSPAPRGSRRPLRHASRVALTATALVAVLSIAVAGVFDVIVFHHLSASTNRRLAERLQLVAHLGTGTIPEVAPTADLDDAPILVWLRTGNGPLRPLTPATPRLAAATARRRHPTDVPLGGTTLRVERLVVPGGRILVAGQSLAQLQRARNDLLLSELIADPLLLAAMYLSALVIGLRASAPVEQARQRQLEFTADASHELRTPLAVMRAEVDLALSCERQPAQYRAVLARIDGEGKRLHRIVDDLLFLARFDAEPPGPPPEPVDLGALADRCAERFAPVATAKQIQLSVDQPADAAVSLQAPPEWIDRLMGVLVDNAIRYAPAGGTARLQVASAQGRAVLGVEDSGPGIPPGERDRLFDRFHRATDDPGGSGLGLAIADSVVRSTHARWHVGDAPGGGARFEVSWPAAVSHVHQKEAAVHA